MCNNLSLEDMSQSNSNNKSNNSQLLKTIVNIITTNLLAQSTKLNKPVDTLLKEQTIIDLAKLFEESKINNQSISKAIELLITNPDQDLMQVLTDNNLIQSTDTSDLIPIVDSVIGNNPIQVDQYRSGKTQVVGFLVGQCMKQSKGIGNPKLFNELLIERLK